MTYVKIYKLNYNYKLKWQQQQQQDDQPGREFYMEFDQFLSHSKAIFRPFAGGFYDFALLFFSRQLELILL